MRKIRERSRRTPNDVALVDDLEALTWAELEVTISRAAAALASLAPEPDQRVAVMGENRAATVITHAAGIVAGVGTVATSRQLTERELVEQFRDAGVVALVAGQTTAAVGQAAARVTGLDVVVVHGGAVPDGAQAWSTWLERVSVPPTDLGSRPARLPLVYTSGTTGKPRGAEVRWASTPCETAAELVAALTERSTFPPGPNLVVGPLQHNAPLTSVRHLLSGEPVIVLGSFDPTDVLASIEKHAVASSVWVPTHMQRLLALPEAVRGHYDLSSLVSVNQTGSACPASVKSAMIEWMGPIFTEAYGGSETGTLCQISSEEWLAHPGSVGRPKPPFKVVVLDHASEPVGAGEIGVLGFRAPTPDYGPRYHHDAVSTARAYLRPDVFTLGDVGYVDTEGYVYVVDRVADMVVSGGVNLYPVEAENVLLEHPGVAQVAVIGVPDPDLGEALLALVIPTDPASPPSPESLQTHARKRIAAYKVPRRYEIRDALAFNAMGKPDKRSMREKYWPATERRLGALKEQV